MAALAANAQTVRPAAPPDTSGNSAVGALPTLGGTVHDRDGQPIPGALIVLTRSDSAKSPTPFTATSDTLGRFLLARVPRGSYELHTLYGPREAAVKRIDVDTGVRGIVDVEISAPGTSTDGWERLWIAGVLLTYFATILIWRWHHIARSVHELLRVHIATLRTRLATEADPGERTEAFKALQTQLDALEGWTTDDWADWGARKPPKPNARAAEAHGQPAEANVEPVRRPRHRGGRLFEFLFWSRGRENAAWVEIHAIESQLISFFTPAEQILGYLVWAEAELRGISNNPGATALADAIKTSLQAGARTSRSETVELLSVRKGLLSRALSIINSERDNSFVTLMEWQDKTSWLIFFALVIIGLLAGTMGRAILFLVGAAGGFASRLSRATVATDVPLDYGASWATLFLSPVFGALAAWFGVALIDLGVQAGVFGSAFGTVKWDNPMSLWTIGLAFLLGFSERFFDTVAGAVTDAVKRAPDKPPGAGAAGKNGGADADANAKPADPAGNADDVDAADPAATLPSDESAGQTPADPANTTTQG
ncbi:MAG: hypothetical protein JWM95_1185 [Gemmatimonadetes bacterium]|nr:hypothetical protein [Gemmatimonadota bacterium]